MNFDEELAALSKEFTELREENARLKAEVKDLKEKLDHTKTLLVRASGSTHA
jgi:cell division protein FtsB